MIDEPELPADVMASIEKAVDKFRQSRIDSARRRIKREAEWAAKRAARQPPKATAEQLGREARERRLSAFSLFHDGAPLAEIADQLGVSKERARQIVRSGCRTAQYEDHHSGMGKGAYLAKYEKYHRDGFRDNRK